MAGLTDAEMQELKDLLDASVDHRAGRDARFIELMNEATAEQLDEVLFPGGPLPQMSRAEWDSMVAKRGHGPTIQYYVDDATRGLTPNIDPRAMDAFKDACPPAVWHAYWRRRDHPRYPTHFEASAPEAPH